ncbi:MAG: D-alanyl-D-alanine carboxypeptidase [Rhodobacteraceae bacterium]|nr:D-alanyl-D-alanine carboxypeptidase [Paracoccaceae bacterium]
MIRTLSRGVFLAICVVLWTGAAQAQQHAALVMDARTGKVVYSQNADTPVHPASLTKMMTLYIVFDQVRQGRLSLDQKVRISAHAASEPPSKLGLRPGQEIELRYLIRAAAVKSANDAATALGETVAGSESAFANLMNSYAAAMGMRNTHFKNANGLTRTGHMSTARDMALLGRRMVYDFPQYYNLFSRRSTSAGIKTVNNTNRRLLDAYPGADGIKTGYTRAAGFNLVSSARKGDKRVIVAVLGGKSTAARNAEVMRLMDLGFGKMPRYAKLDPPASLRMRTVAVASAAPSAAALAAPSAPAKALAGSTSGIAVARVAQLSRSTRPIPRSVGWASGPIARNSESIAAAIAEVNAELASANVSKSRVDLGGLIGRPAPRPDDGATESAPMAVASAGSASTFAASAANAAPRPEAVAAEVPPARTVPVSLTTSEPTSTGGHEWGVQIGVHRAKADAERQLLTTALKDVPQLSGSLRRIESSNVSGVTIYRAQFVGLSQESAVSACRALQQLDSDCAPIAPGT